MKMRDALTIVGRGHREPGLIVYGFYDSVSARIPTVDGWPELGAARSNVLSGDGYRIVVLDVPLLSFPAPARWPALVDAMLVALLEAGAVVSWAGWEGMLVEPPGLFDPIDMAGSVWAARTKDANFTAPGLDEEVRTLDDDALAVLRTAAGGISSGTLP